MFCDDFSRSKSYAFPPEFSIGDTQVLEVKKTHRILGIQVQDDMRWQAQVDEMVRRATKTTWVLRRMRALGVDQGSLVAYWKAEGRVQLPGLAVGPDHPAVPGPRPGPEGGHGGHKWEVGGLAHLPATGPGS